MSRPSDPLGVLSSTEPVVTSARHVTIDQRAARSIAERIAASARRSAEWDDATHWRGNPSSTANYVLVLDALNFCFWGEPRWRVMRDGEMLDGYWALTAALRRALDADIPLTDARYLAGIPALDVAMIFRGEHVIPLFSARVRNLREAGSVLLDRWDGEFLNVIDAAGGSAVRLVELVADQFPSFRDETTYDGREVRFYKRAQILISDLAGSFQYRGPGAFDDLDALTAFADYKVPQVLHHLGILVYDDHLTSLLRAKIEITEDAGEEVEIRAATIQAVELLRQHVADLGGTITAWQIDWHLWNLGQSLPANVLPYHRTRTIYY